MRVAMMTREYPPEIYGGAGVHVAELTRHLRDIVPVDVHCMGGPRDEADVYVHGVDDALAEANPAIKTLSTGLRMATAAAATDISVVHSHTWYAGLGGHLTGLLKEIPHVATAHSLEPHRPWKKEQLGGGYNVSSWSEFNAMTNADAVIAVSARMKDSILDAYPTIDPDRIHVVLNGIDTVAWQPRPTFEASEEANGWSELLSRGVDPNRPIVAFVGRITRQKGVGHLIRAAAQFDPAIQLVLCAGAPDTPEIAAETRMLVEDLQSRRSGVVWVQDMVDRQRLQEILTAADIFVCPSIYEPLGIVNLEAMACRTAVVASDVGGIPEVVIDGETGVLVHYDEAAPETFQRDLAAQVNALIADPERSRELGLAGRRRAELKFNWSTIARQTVDVYQSLL